MSTKHLARRGYDQKEPVKTEYWVDMGIGVLSALREEWRSEQYISSKKWTPKIPVFLSSSDA